LFDKKNRKIHFLRVFEKPDGYSIDYISTAPMKDIYNKNVGCKRFISIDSTNFILRYYTNKKKTKFSDFKCKMKAETNIKNGLSLFLFSGKNGSMENLENYNYLPGLVEYSTSEYFCTQLINYKEIKMVIQLPLRKVSRL
jgi:hypothetical protein